MTFASDDYVELAATNRRAAAEGAWAVAGPDEGEDDDENEDEEDEDDGDGDDEDEDGEDGGGDPQVSALVLREV